MFYLIQINCNSVSGNYTDCSLLHSFVNKSDAETKLNEYNGYTGPHFVTMIELEDFLPTDNITIDFGKHKGDLLDLVPISYVIWMYMDANKHDEYVKSRLVSFAIKEKNRIVNYNDSVERNRMREEIRLREEKENYENQRFELM